MRALFGTHYYSGSEDSINRQSDVARRNLTLKSAEFVNLQFQDEPERGLYPEGHEVVPKMTMDSRQLAGEPSLPRKPIISECFSILYEEANRRGYDYFGFYNSDIYLSPDLEERCEAEPYDAHIFTRYNVDDLDDLDHGFGLYHGQDTWVFSLKWWQEHGFRIRPFIIGEGFFDTVVTTIALTHSKARLWLAPPMTFHVNHPVQWEMEGTPYADYNRRLAWKDSFYRKVWMSYRKNHLEEELPIRYPEFMSIQDEYFASGPGMVDKLLMPAYHLKSYLHLKTKSARK